MLQNSAWKNLIAFFCRLLLLCLLCLPASTALGANPSAPLAKTITSAAEFGYPPFSIVDENGQASGFSVELLKAALATMGYEVQFETGPWSEVKQWLVDGKVQVLPLVGRTPEREAVFDFTFPYLSMHGTIIVRNDEQQIAELKDLYGRRVAVLKGDNAEEFVRRCEINAKVETTASFEAALQGLSAGKYDAVVIQKLLGQQLIKKLGLTNLRFVGPPLEEFVQSFCFAVPEGSSKLLSILNEGLSILFADGTFRRLHTKWFAEFMHPPRSRLLVGGDKNYPPYEYLDENGQPTGFNVDLTRAVAEELNLNIEIILDDWNIIRNKLVTGQIDAIQGMFYSVERDREFGFSPPHSIVKHSIVTRKGDKPLTTMADLAGRSILVMQGDIMHDVAITHGYADQITAVNSQEEALKRLAVGEADCVLVAQVPALYWIKKNGWDNLVVSDESVLSPEYCYAVSQSNEVLLAELSNALTVLKETGEYRRIYSKWFNVYQADEISVKTILTYSALLVAPVLIVAICIVIWNRLLKKQVNIRTEELLVEVAERKKAEQHLAAQQEKFKNLFEHVSDYALVLKMEGEGLTIVDLSESACKHHGYSRQELLGQPLQLLDSDLRDYKKNVAALNQVRLGDTVRLDVMHRRKDGSIFPVETVIKMIEIDGEELLYAIERDVTARKKAEHEKQELERQIRQKHKMEAVGMLAGGMAHNFNNNLSIILGNLELAHLKSATAPEIVEHLAQAKTALLRSRELIKQIMIYSRQDGHDFKPTKASEIIDETYQLLISTIPTSINFDRQISDTAAEEMINADSTRIQEALINLCNNAVFAMEEKGELKISLDLCTVSQEEIPHQYPASAGSFVRIQVADSGCGIPETLLDKIFDPFFTTKPLHEGTGMGLSTVRGIIEQHKGFIQINSQLERGTTISLYFPKADAPTVEVKEKDQDLRGGTERILFVDDEEMLAQLGQRLLQSLGYRVTVQTDPQKALQLIKDDSEPFDLIITDQTMPELTGIELIQQVKQIHPEIPVILSTGYSSQVTQKEADQFGVSAFCFKPLEMTALAQTIRSCLDQA